MVDSLWSIDYQTIDQITSKFFKKHKLTKINSFLKIVDFFAFKAEISII